MVMWTKVEYLWANKMPQLRPCYCFWVDILNPTHEQSIFKESNLTTIYLHNFCKSIHQVVKNNVAETSFKSVCPA